VRHLNLVFMMLGLMITVFGAYVRVSFTWTRWV
jgi:hypothetical protein